MKKKYEKPRLEVTEFCFSEHIAASSCYRQWTNIGENECSSWENKWFNNVSY